MRDDGVMNGGPVDGLQRRPVLVSLGSFASLLTLGLAPAFARAAAADDAAAWSALRQPRAIALMRHADAPGVGDPAGYRLDDCSTQRNLSERGRAQARNMGTRLRAERINVTRVLSSPWCRCRDTAELLGVGAAQAEQAFANVYLLRDQRDALTAAARTLLRQWQGPGVLVVVTHAENINALTGYSPSSAELVVVAAGADGTLRRVAGIAAG